MKIAVVGLGGVGGYIAASLAKTGHEIVGFARGEHLREIQTNGIKIIEDETSWHVDLKALELQEASGYFDIVLFCVKTYDLEESYQKMAHFIDEKSILLSLSNGVDNASKLKTMSNSVVLQGCIYILSHIDNPGVIRKKSNVFALIFGSEDEVAVAKFAKVLDEAQLRYKTPHNIQTAVWKKYIFISAYATLTSYYDKSIGYIDEFYKDKAAELLSEIASLASAKQIDIGDEVEKSLETASKVPYDSSTSMHLDFQKKKKTELESLSGYVVKEAQRHGVKTPLMKEMYSALLLKANSV